MAYLVNDNCIKCKFTDCVEVCPVDCFYEGENMLVINPNECIDCGVCEPECPADAIITDNVDGANKWFHINEDLSAKWPNITVKKDPLPNADEMILEPNKFERFFTENPGSVDEDTKT